MDTPNTDDNNDLTPVEIRRLQSKATQYDRLMDIARERADQTKGFYYHNDTDPEFVHALLNHYDREIGKVITNANRFRDKIVAWMRAFQMNVQMVELAYTHAEKNARLRGLDDLATQAIDEIDGDFAEKFRYDWFPDSLFGSTRQNAQLQRRVWELEQTNDELATQLAEPHKTIGEDDDAPDNEDIPW